MFNFQQQISAFEHLRATAEAAGWAELPLMGDALVGLGAALAEQGQLGEGLALPPWLEPERATLERELTPII